MKQNSDRVYKFVEGVPLEMAPKAMVDLLMPKQYLGRGMCEGKVGGSKALLRASVASLLSRVYKTLQAQLQMSQQSVLEQPRERMLPLGDYLFGCYIIL